MTRLSFLLLLVLIAAAPLTQASPKPWMKSRAPDQLPVYVFEIPACPLTKEEVTEIIRGELTRARLKMVADTRAPLQLWFKMQCNRVSSESENYLFNLEVDFGAWNKDLEHHRLGETSYGAYGINNADFISNAVKKTVSDALTDYLKVNFGL